jgi:RNA polymerase sigma-70 factor (ECF subfamily)
MTPSDQDLMLEVSRGDVRSLATLFDRHHRKLFAFFVRMTASREASEDLVQEVFLRILRYRASYRPDGSFRTWMYQIARNVRTDHLARRVKDEAVGEPVEVLPEAAVGPVNFSRRQEVRILEKALERLPDEKREIILLARFEGLSHEEIGSIIGCETATVRVRVFRAVAELREIFFGLTGEKTLWNAQK